VRFAAMLLHRGDDFGLLSAGLEPAFTTDNQFNWIGWFAHPGDLAEAE
jgi:hypothetical protein